MAVPFMRTYTEQLVRVCHRRGAHAIGGMAAFVPNRRDPAVTEAAVAKVREDKQREAAAGFDGTWVAHPDLVPVAMEVFRAQLGDRPNQKELRRDDVRPDAGALLRVDVTDGRVTEAGVRTNVDVALLYLDAWLRGAGAVAIHNLMEDAATAEISRAQLWQWVRHRVRTEDDRPLTPERYAAIRDEILAALERERGDAPSRLREAADLLDRLVLGEEFVEFLTLLAYPMLEPDVDALRGARSADGEPRATEGRATGERPKPVLLTGDIVRDYSAADVERLRGTVRVAHTVASLGAARLRALLDSGRPIQALGAVTAAQGAELARGGMEALYAAPPCDVAALSDALVRAQQLAPIIAEVGAAEPQAVFERTRALVAGGVAAVVVDLSRLAEAECAPTLNAARLAADVADVPTVLVARVRDAERGVRCAAYADVLWLDGVPADAAARVASRVRAAAPGRALAYDFSAHADTPALEAAQRALEEAGVRLELFAGAGALVERLGALALARDFRSRGAAAWAELRALDPGGEIRPELPPALGVLSLPSGS
jgi:malate synthase